MDRVAPRGVALRPAKPVTNTADNEHRQENTVTDQTAPAAEESLCCGERIPGVAGEPLKLSCQLCPKSNSYWRLPEDVRQAP